MESLLWKSIIDAHHEKYKLKETPKTLRNPVLDRLMAQKRTHSPTLEPQSREEESEHLAKALKLSNENINFRQGFGNLMINRNFQDTLSTATNQQRDFITPSIANYQNDPQYYGDYGNSLLHVCENDSQRDPYHNSNTFSQEIYSQPSDSSSYANYSYPLGYHYSSQYEQYVYRPHDSGMYQSQPTSVTTLQSTVASPPQTLTMSTSDILLPIGLPPPPPPPAE